MLIFSYPAVSDYPAVSEEQLRAHGLLPFPVSTCEVNPTIVFRISRGTLVPADQPMSLGGRVDPRLSRKRDHEETAAASSPFAVQPPDGWPDRYGEMAMPYVIVATALPR